MKYVLTFVWVAGLAAGLAAQNPKAKNTLDFQKGAKIDLSYNHVDLKEGKTLENLTGTGEESVNFRKFFNDSGFDNVIGGRLKLNMTTEIAGRTIDPGSYKLSFRIDEDGIWYLVVLTRKSEEVFSAVLDVVESKKESSDRLVIQPLATSNKKSTGVLRIRFGALSADVEFAAGVAEK